MKRIMTVLGPIAPENLGVTSMHEHILVDASFFRRKYGEFVPEALRGMGDDPVSLGNLGILKHNIILVKANLMLGDEQEMAEEVAAFKASGGSAIVDLSPIGLRLDLPGIQRISQSTGVHVVTSTGFYMRDSWPEPYRQMTSEQLALHMITEIKEGVGDTGVKPGHIKIGVDDLNEQEERALRAAARAAKETGLSVSVHPGFGIGSDGRRIAKILAEESMPLDRVILAHTEGFIVEHDLKSLALRPETWGLRLDYAKTLLDQGVNISIDCFGHYWNAEPRNMVIETDWQRLGGLVALIQAGYSHQIVLGTDTFVKILTRHYGGEGYCRLTRFVIPTLRDIGVSDYDIRQMTVENPARLLAC